MGRVAASHSLKPRDESRCATASVFLPHQAVPTLQILCAEDDPLEGRALLHILALEGHNVELVMDGRAARDRIVREPGRFQLLITDHDMPYLTGLGLVREARSADFAGRIIVHTGRLDEAAKRAYREYDVDAFVEKVSGIERLLGAIRSRPLSEPHAPEMA